MKTTTEKFTPSTATAVIIANMVGTGVFTALGFQLLEIQSGFVLLFLWFIGGVAALCGAMTYAELGAALPRSGGEYNFLSRIYHPSAGFVSGWISATVGFAAPTAAAAITFSKYLLPVFISQPSEGMSKLIACTLVIILTLIHSTNRRNSGSLQSVFTALKIGVIIVFCITALIAVKNPQPISFAPSEGDLGRIFSAPFAISLIFVSYGYTGWNAATYLSGEVNNPQRALPRILIGGTLIVMILYVSLNFVFLRVTPLDDMIGQPEVGYIAAKSVFGQVGADFFGIVLATLLISTVSAMTMAGPRVLQMIGEDFTPLSILGRTNKNGVPRNAIFLQSAVALIFIIATDLETIIKFAGAMLAFNSFLAVLGVFILRFKEPDLPRPYKTFLYPLTPIIYLCLTAATLIFVIHDNPISAMIGAGLIIAGFVFYRISTNQREMS